MSTSYLSFRNEQKVITGPWIRVKIWKTRRTFLERLADRISERSTEAELPLSFFGSVSDYVQHYWLLFPLMTSINQNQICNKIYSE